MAGILAEGMRNCRRNFSIWCFLYFSRLLLAAVFSMPLLVVVNASLENSCFATPLLTGWSLDAISELVMTRENVLVSFLVMLVFYSVLVFLLKQLVNGGIYRAFLSRPKVSARDFFGEGVVTFAGHLKISALMGVVYVPLIVISQMVASLLPDGLFLGFGAVSLYRILVRFALLYPFLILGAILSDLLRFRLAACPNERLPAGLRAAMDTYRASFVQLNGIYYMYLLPFAVIWILVEWIALKATGGLGNMFGVVLELLLFQFCSFLRTGQSLFCTATIATLLKQRQADRYQLSGVEIEG